MSENYEKIKRDSEKIPDEIVSEICDKFYHILKEYDKDEVSNAELLAIFMTSISMYIAAIMLTMVNDKDKRVEGIDIILLNTKNILHGLTVRQENLERNNEK